MPALSPLRRHWNVLLAMALIGLAFVPGVAQQGVDLAELPDRAMDTLGWSLVVAQGAVVGLLRRWPGWSLILGGAGFATYQLLAYPTTVAALGLLVIVAGAGALARHHRCALAAGAACAYVALAFGLSRSGSPTGLVDYIAFGMLLCLLWVAGAWARDRMRAQQQQRWDNERRAVEVERGRIARELHDVVTHHVTAMVIQAEAAQYSTADLQQTRSNLSTIGETGRAALDDLRDLLGALDGASASSEREPAIKEVAGLVAQAHAAGQPVELIEVGQPRPLTGAAGLAVSRIVQEGLTNAMKHARGAATLVRLHYDETGVDVTVTTNGAGAAGSPQGSGRGLRGLEERVALVGGELHAGPVADGFTVQARVPA